MKIGREFNKIKKSEYFHYIENHKKYTDFNILGIYLSICENDKLDVDDKIEVRDYANQFFQKTFDFYPIKDPKTWFNLTTLGREMTKADERQVWKDIRTIQENIIKEKKFGHRNFGTYARHNCGIKDCPLNGVMLQSKNKDMAEAHGMWFESDEKKYPKKMKSERAKKERTHKNKLIQQHLDEEND